jgi:sterol desaturase/sphingolipid hydroxylase (fatty acid hydroxylase superfamily)
MGTLTTVLLIAGPMFLIEWRWPGRRWPERRRWLARAVAFNVVQVLIVVVAGLTWNRWLAGQSFWTVADLGVTAGAAIGYLVITFVYYWWHRARHEIPFLWRWLHQVHHSPQRLELLTSFYKHPFEIAINGMLSSVILFVLVGATPAQAGLAIVLTGATELFYHWNIKTPYWLGWFIQRPESHCVHHARGTHTHNFSDLPLWDMLFGTFLNPRREDFKCGFGGDKEMRLWALLLGRHLTSPQPTREQ